MAARERGFQSGSVTSRRFPALRTLTVDDVEGMVVPGASSPKAKAAATATGKHLFDPNLVKPSAVEGIGARAPAAMDHGQHGGAAMSHGAGDMPAETGGHGAMGDGAEPHQH